MKMAAPSGNDDLAALREGMGRMNITSRGSIDLSSGVGSKEARESGRGREVSTGPLSSYDS